MSHPPSFAGAEVNPAPFGYFPGTRIHGRGGAVALAQVFTGNGWRLFTLGGAQHQCPKGTR